jgi:hypothetical protein
LRWLNLENDSVAGYARSHGGQSTVALHNLSSSAQRAALPVELRPGRVRDVLSGQAWTDGAGRLQMGPYEFRWLVRD